MESLSGRDVSARLAAGAARHGLWRPGARLLLAVSGGADSIALLHLLHRLAPAEGLQLEVAHVDHGWRRESADDAAWVGQVAADLGLACHRRRLEPPAGGNREERARREREAWFGELLAAGVAEAVATAHTRDDQAETVLLRLLRGAGPGGLAAIAPARGLRGASGRLIRPALELGRAELRAWLGERGLGWREDASNRRLAPARNRVRHSVLPWLELEFNPRLAAALARTAELARAENEVWEAWLAPLAERIWRPAGEGGWRAERAELLAQPLAVQRRLLRHGLERVGGGAGGAGRAGDYALGETLLAWLREGAPRRRRLRRGILGIVVTSGGLEVRPAGPGTAAGL